MKVRSAKAYSRVRIEVAETPFFPRSVSEFVLARPRTEYTIYPDIIWNYEALKNNNQAEPISVAVTVEMNRKKLGQRVRTFSVRSINECLLGYVTGGTRFHDTGIFFAAYVNEENPMMNHLLREALNTRIVNRFPRLSRVVLRLSIIRFMPCGMFYRNVISGYSSVSNTSLSAMWFSLNVFVHSMMPWSHRKISVWIGSVLFASLLRAIKYRADIGTYTRHMFVGYYTDANHKDMKFLETTMIGDVDLDDFFPDEQLDSTMVGKTQNQMSRITFDKSKEYASRKYKRE